MAEGRHGAAQAIGFVGGELGGDDGQLHRLFLEQGHAQRLVQDILQFILPVPGARLGIVEHHVRIVALQFAALEIGMHHAALDGAGPHDRHFHHQIVEFFGLEARQHAHLGAAFHLEHADGVGPLQAFRRRQARSFGTVANVYFGFAPRE